ncbi:hypothetical protein [Paraburkholderia acidisoli]|uniref:Phasin domain-containing protein n=1 Tax=Paraburkholderia acidisoli TaxID=2571748 RepID=A0A7Z2JFB9_9BURK|nr:hypothetical protein [Paraburkholderia acidisoli]QGZ63262.1 hypothetical protein FAZ98_15775 [Paraburkholderia acidisoli]
MVTASQPAFDAWRAGSIAALRLYQGRQQGREQWLQFMQRRVERDRAALEGAMDALREARDWSEYAIASQTVSRDWFNASAALWQETAANAVQGPLLWSEVARDFAQQWTDVCAGFGAVTMSMRAARPVRAWMNAFERTMSDTVHETNVEAKANGAVQTSAAPGA